MTRRKILILSVLGLMAVALAQRQSELRSNAVAPEESGADPAVRLTVETIRPERVVLASEYSGRVAAGRRVEIRPQVGGLIIERHVEAGTQVLAGDVLFRIDPAPLNADLVVAEAALARAEATEAHSNRPVWTAAAGQATALVSLAAAQCQGRSSSSRLIL